MNTVIWIFQGLLTAIFFFSGLMKVSKSKVALSEHIGWVDSFGESQIKTIGILEITGAVGLILPMVLNILPVLSVAAATGLSLTMIGAMLVHTKRKEFKEIGLNIVLLISCLIVIIGRVYLVPVF